MASEPTVILAGASLLILYTGSILGLAAWLNNQLKAVKVEILTDFNAKHNSNTATVRALEEMVIRHDTWLNPEWRSAAYTKQRAHNGN